MYPFFLVEASGACYDNRSGIYAGHRQENRIAMPAAPQPKRRYIQIPFPYFFREVIVKLHAECNLACLDCYMYTTEGNLWRERDKVMSDQVIDQAAERLREYMAEVRLRHMTVVLHGGEPLLAGMHKIRYLVETFRGAIPKGCTIDFSIQTNATLVTDECADVLAGLGIQVGVSLDGNEQGNGTRLYRNGRSSYHQAVAGLERLKERGILSGILTVIRLGNDPVETATELYKLYPAVDCILPIKGWDVEPTERPSYESTPTPYADWLIEFYRQWHKVGGSYKDIRILQKIERLVAAHFLQAPLHTMYQAEYIGPWCVPGLVIETDGAMERADSLNAVHNGDATTGYNIFDHRIMHALVDVIETSTQQGIVSGAPMCQTCHLHKLCGGGLPANRFGPKNGYRNVSSYCADLQKLILTAAHNRWLCIMDTERHMVPFKSFEEAMGLPCTTQTP